MDKKNDAAMQPKAAKLSKEDKAARKKSDKWYIRQEGEQRIGPIPHKELMALIGDGLLDSDAFVWNEADGFNEWVSVGQMQSLNIRKSQMMLPQQLYKDPDRLKWFVINQKKERMGPMNEAELRIIIKENEASTDKLYAWNGKTVKKWTHVSKIPSLQAEESPHVKPVEKAELHPDTWWYAAKADNTKLGPMLESELAQRVMDNKLTMTSLVFNGDSVKQWAMIKDVDGLGTRILNQLQPNVDRWYMVSADNKRMGPMDTSQVIKGFKMGIIGENTMLCNGKSIKKWTEFQNISYLVHKLGIYEPAKRVVTQNWYVRDKNGELKGPMDHNQMLKLLKDGEIDDDTMIYQKEKTKKWVRLKDNDFVKTLAQNLDSKDQNKRIKVLQKRVFEHQAKVTHGWYAQNKDKQKKGPMNCNDVIKMFEDGEINYSSPVFHENVTRKWVKFKNTKMGKKKRRENKHLIETESGSSSSLIPVILEVDNHAHRRFMDQILNKRDEIFQRRIDVERIKKRERMKMLVQTTKEIKADAVKLHRKKTVHDNAADVAISWRTNNNLGPMEEIFGFGLKQSEAIEAVEQTNVTIHRIERICAAIKQFEIFEDEDTDDSVLIDKVDDLVFDYFENGRKFPQRSETVSSEQSKSKKVKSGTVSPAKESGDEDNEEEKQKIESKVSKEEDSKWWVTDIHKKRTGPMTLAQLTSLYTLGEINEDCYIYHKQQSPEWVKINKLPKIHSKLQKYMGTQLKHDAPNESDSKWFILDVNNDKIGPMTFDVLREFYTNLEEVDSNCSIWNRQYVKQWTKICDLPSIESRLKGLEETVVKEKDSKAGKRDEERSQMSLEAQTVDDDTSEVVLSSKRESLEFELTVDDETFAKYIWFAADKNKNRYGPMSFVELEELYCVKKSIDKDCLVYNGETIASWTKIKKIKALFDRLQETL